MDEDIIVYSTDSNEHFDNLNPEVQQELEDEDYWYYFEHGGW